MRFAERHQRARVVARFERSAHIAAGGEVICLVSPALGNGPLNAVVAGATAWPREGEAVAFSSDRPRVGDTLEAEACSVDCAGAVTWRSASPGRLASAALCRDAVEALRALAETAAPADGLARSALGLPVAGTALLRVAAPRVEQLRRWLVRLDEPAPITLLGLGPGLTPSGDDLLCGVMIALGVTGQTQRRALLSGAVLSAAPGLTSPLSCAFLAAAADGEGAEALHAALNAMIEGRSKEDVVGLAAAAGRIGHTSGWDALAGAALALSAVMERDMSLDPVVACVIEKTERTSREHLPDA